MPRSLTFNSGDPERTFTAFDDSVDNDDESVKLTFGTMPDDRVSTGTREEATVRGSDDDPH